MQKTNILITDLDGTLTGNAAGLSEFKVFLNSFEQTVYLIYVTGRHLHSAMHLITTDSLPVPYMFITDIGTAIYDGDTFQEDIQWQQQMQDNWDAESVFELSNGIEGLHLQSLPNTKRVSFIAEKIESVHRLKHALSKNRVMHKLIFSKDKYVDILPKKSGKGNAVFHILQKNFGAHIRILIAGDSGNDAEMLSLGYPSVVVGNAHPELRFLESYPHVYKAKKSHAAGIKEGWQYFYDR